MSNIIWLASYPKSGNTWLRMFLESVFTPPDRKFDINRTDYSILEADYNFYKKVLGQEFDTSEHELVHTLRPEVHQMLATITPGSLLVKTHNAFVNHGGVEMISPAYTTGAVYVVRNPLDVIDSWSDHLAISHDEVIDYMNKKDAVSNAVPYVNVREYYTSWSLHVASWRQAPIAQNLIVRYEDLLSEPVTTFGKIANFLGLGLSESDLKRHVDLTSFDKLREQEDASSFVETSKKSKSGKFFRQGRAGAYRDKLTPEQISKFYSLNKDMMDTYGYQPD